MPFSNNNSNYDFENIDRNSQSIVVGEIDKYGNYVVNSDVSSFRNSLEKSFLAANGYSIELTDVSIRKSFDEGFKKTIYYLLFSNVNSRNNNGKITKIGKLLTLENNNFRMTSGGDSCTCTGCTSGCDPSWSAGKCTCSACTYSSEKCSKSVTSTNEVY